ncbi:MAG: carbohydrate ABC transporter permease, partial [Caldilineaceae bacterium]|nr:carbohydrate ABC transporter permease [Caldilineaceae bacterium]
MSATPDTMRTATHAGPHVTMRQRNLFNRTLTHLVLLFGVVFMFIPLVWTLSTSLKSPGEVYIFPPTWIPKEILWSNYYRAVTAIPFFLYLWNTVF